MSNAKSKVANTLIGIAGVHFVVSELSLRGLIALPTIRNTAGVDVIVASSNGSWHANLQVKTSQRKVTFWPVSTHYEQWRGGNNFYVFVRFLGNESRFEAFLESADLVAQQVRAETEKFRARGLKDWAPCWGLPKDEKECERLRRQWREFGQGHSAQY
ncbi:MAG TPA: hypothetical protein G4O03_01625 [Dehalococcoidia bacterium]|jgi:hypothetical protein|nr:hypothetical protein [Dehalococcoidia bacterium]